MEQKIALKVNSKDNVATIFADDVIDGSIVALRDEKGRSEQDIRKGEYVHVHNLDSMRGRGDLPERNGEK